MKTTKYIALAVVALVAAGALNASAATKKKTAAKPKAQAEQVIFTGEIAKKVIGYSGTTPLNITVKNGKIAQIEVLPNKETPQYLKRAIAKVIPQFEGLTVEQALKLKADVATGATYTSEALIKNIQMGLKDIKK